ncbi:MAG: dihydroorotate dehydrogenase electron transfer subunit [Ruminococcaceae bacterium]|nr:dihydroorotate dehydrogenase electron transfer subunit [Oscillospiraceae bacterium]
MMKQGVFTVKSNRFLTENVLEMILEGDTSDIKRPGQFVNIKLNGLYLRRPISVCDCKENELKIIYKTVGKGTEMMAEMSEGQRLDVLTGLGNGFNIAKSGDKPVLIGGGVGVPPMYLLCKKLIEKGVKPTVILGFNTQKEIFYKDEFESLGVKTLVTTVDGSFGIKGFVTDALKGVDCSYYFCCGPMPMLKAVYSACDTSGQLSFEERMGCGIGACMGCSCKTITGYKRICTEGPVLEKEEILW